MKTGARIFFACMVIALVSGVMFSSPKEQRRQKARYYYLLGVEREASGDDAEAYEYFRRSAQTDTSYREGVYAYNTLRFRLSSDSLSEDEMRRALPEVRKFVDAYPGDIFESRYYAYLATNLGEPKEAVDIYLRVDSIYPGKTDVLLDLADSYMRTDSLEAALATLSRVEDIEGKSAELSMRKIIFRMSQKDSVGALGEATRLIESNPGNSTFHILRGNVFEALHQPDSAMAEYRAAASLDPEGSAPRLAMAGVYAQQGDSTRFDDMMYQVLLCEDLEPGNKLEITSQYLSRIIADKSDTGRGDHLFAVLREQYPHDPEVLDLSARYSAAKGDWKLAEEEISYAIDLKPEDAEYRTQLMAYYIADDKPMNAVEAYRKTEKYMPPTEGMKQLLSTAYALVGDYDKSISTIEGVIRDYSPQLPMLDSISDKRPIQGLDIQQLYRLSNAYTSLGDAYSQKGDTISAIQAYKNAIAVFPDNAMAINNYAYFLCLQGDLQLAEKLAASALYLAPDNPSVLDTYAWVLFKLKKYDDAAKYQASAIEHTPEGDETEELYHHYGDILFMAGKPEEAVEYWQKALDLAPDNELLKKKVTNRTYFYE